MKGLYVADVQYMDRKLLVVADSNEDAKATVKEYMGEVKLNSVWIGDAASFFQKSQVVHL